jgi:hypothetical protein
MFFTLPRPNIPKYDGDELLTVVLEWEHFITTLEYRNIILKEDMTDMMKKGFNTFKDVIENLFIRIKLWFSHAWNNHSDYITKNKKEIESAFMWAGQQRNDSSSVIEYNGVNPRRYTGIVGVLRIMVYWYENNATKALDTLMGMDSLAQSPKPPKGAPLPYAKSHSAGYGFIRSDRRIGGTFATGYAPTGIIQSTRDVYNNNINEFESRIDGFLEIYEETVELEDIDNITEVSLIAKAYVNAFKEFSKYKTILNKFEKDTQRTIDKLKTTDELRILKIVVKFINLFQKFLAILDVEGYKALRFIQRKYRHFGIVRHYNKNNKSK